MATSLVESRKKGANVKRMTALEQAFCLHLLADEDWNVSEAVRKAGYKSKTPGQTGYKLLKKPYIKAFLGKAKRDREERTKFTSDRIWERLHTILEFDPSVIFEVDEDNWYRVKPLAEIPLELRKMIKGIKYEPKEVGGLVMQVTYVTFQDKDVALQIASKQAIPERHEHSAVSKEQLMSELLEQVEKKRNVIDGEVISRLVEQGAKK